VVRAKHECILKKKMEDNVVTYEGVEILELFSLTTISKLHN